MTYDDIVAHLVRMFPVINGGLLVTLIGLYLKNKFENRKLTVEENAGLRTEFISEMHALRDEATAMRKEMGMLRANVTERDERIITLQGEIRDLHAEVRNLNGIMDAMRQANRSTQDMVAQAIVEPAMRAELAKLSTVPNVPGAS